MESKHKFIGEFLGHYFDLLQEYDFLDYSLTKDKIERDEIEGKESIEAIIEKYCAKNYHILYGFYTLFDSDQGKIVNIHKQYIEDKYIPIPTVFSKDILNTFSRLIEEVSKGEKDTFWDLPDAYRVNNWVSCETNYLHNCYSNTYSQSLNKKAAYNIILSEEVLFFLCGKFILEGETIERITTLLCLDQNYDNTSQVTPNLKQLIKFALSVENKLGERKLHDKLGINSDFGWNDNEEYKIRRKVEIEIDNKLIQGEVKVFITEINPFLTEIINLLLQRVRKEFEEKFFFHAEISTFSDVKLWQKIARFNFTISESVLKESPTKVFHDILLFPILKSKIGNFKTNSFFYEKCLVNGAMVEIGVPFVMTCFITTLYGFDDSLLDEDEESLKGLNITMEVCKNFAKPLVDEMFYTKLISAKLKPSATKSAISQVMARNASHNIGSHVMNKLINAQKLRELNINKFHTSSGAKNNYQTDIKLTTDSDVFSQLAIFNNYVKCRMDYLSDVTFGTPLMQTTKKINQELFKDLDKVRLLLENISGLSHFIYKIQFKYNDKEINNVNDLSVSLPNDILGCQAFYNIIENIIRNTAKHAKNKLEETIFTINFCEIDEANDLKDATKNLIVEASNYYKVEIFDNVSILDYSDLIENQNRKLNESILNPETNTLRASGLGLIEMEASACYLRKLDIANIEQDSFNISTDNRIYNDSGEFNIIKAFEKAENGEKYLGYRLFMLRPAEIIIVTDSTIEEITCNKWKLQGVNTISIQAFKDILDNGVFNHQFLVYDDTSIKNILIEKATSLPIRQLYYEDVRALLTSEIFKDLSLILWQEWEKVLKDAYKYQDLHIGNSTSDDSTKINAVLLDHLGNDSKEKSENQSKCEWQDRAKSDDIFYLDAMPSKSQQKLPEFEGSLKFYFGDKLDKEEDKYHQINFIKLSESIFCRVLAIDERLQEAKEEDYMGIKFEELYEKTQIIIPKEFDLSAKNFEPSFIANLEAYIETNIKILNHNLDFILIHYSILERMYASKMAKINDYLDELAKCTNVIVTSGRGTPEGLSSKVRFVNLSPIITSFVEIRSKYLASNLLHSTRKSNRI